MNPIRTIRRLACTLTGLAVTLAAAVAVAPAAFAGTRVLPGMFAGVVTASASAAARTRRDSGGQLPGYPRPGSCWGSFFRRIGRAACIVWPAPEFVRGPDARHGPGP